MDKKELTFLLEEGEGYNLEFKESDSSDLARNTLLFGLMQRMDLVENVGSGIKRMRAEMNGYGLNGPEFEISEDWFTIIFKRPALQRLGEKLGENQRTIVELMRQDTSISIPKIAEKAGISTTAVENNIAKLKKQGIIKRVGSAKAGYWIVAG